MTDLPFQRPPDLQGRIDALHDALDKSAARREELCDERRAEHHDIRLLHPKTDSDQCRTCREAFPCKTLRVIDKETVA
jgi:hypothetical protein